MKPVPPVLAWFPVVGVRREWRPDTGSAGRVGRLKPKSVFPTFGRFLLLAMVMGTIDGHDHHR